MSSLELRPIDEKIIIHNVRLQRDVNTFTKHLGSRLSHTGNHVNLHSCFDEFSCVELNNKINK